MLQLCAKMQTRINTKAYDKLREKTFFVTNFTEMTGDLTGPEAWKQPHPMYQERFDKYRQIIIDTKDSKHDTISFGDSLMDGWTKKEFTAVDEDRNFNIGGSWAPHMEHMFTTILPILEKYEVEFSNIIIGCLGGNPLLAHQPLQTTIDHSLAVLNKLRELVPSNRARLIVYGIPPTVSKYVTDNAQQFEDAIYKWVLRDFNAVFLPLQRKFAKWLIFPKAVMNADGVHFTPNGIVDFDTLLNRAKDLSGLNLIRTAKIVD